MTGRNLRRLNPKHFVFREGKTKMSKRKIKGAIQFPTGIVRETICGVIQLSNPFSEYSIILFSGGTALAIESSKMDDGKMWAEIVNWKDPSNGVD